MKSYRNMLTLLLEEEKGQASVDYDFLAIVVIILLISGIVIFREEVRSFIERFTVCVSTFNHTWWLIAEICMALFSSIFIICVIWRIRRFLKDEEGAMENHDKKIME